MSRVIAAIFNGIPLSNGPLRRTRRHNNLRITNSSVAAFSLKPRLSHKPRYFTAVDVGYGVSHHPTGINRRQEDLSSTLILPIPFLSLSLFSRSPRVVSRERRHDSRTISRGINPWTGSEFRRKWSTKLVRLFSHLTAAISMINFSPGPGLRRVLLREVEPGWS